MSRRETGRRLLRAKEHLMRCTARGNPGRVHNFCRKSRIYFGRRHFEPFCLKLIVFSEDKSLGNKTQEEEAVPSCLGGE